MKIEVVLIACGAIFLVSRLASGAQSAAPWEVVTTVAVGIAWGLQPVQRPPRRAALSFAAVVAFVVLSAMLLVDGQLFVLPTGYPAW